MFGYPTGVGCLLARSRRWRRCGGRGLRRHGELRDGERPRVHPVAGEAGFEDGTLNYLAIPAVEIGLRHLQAVGMDTINTRIRCLTAGCCSGSSSCSTAMGITWCASTGRSRPTARGGTITLNFYDPRDICSTTGGRGDGGAPGDLAAHRLLLQPGRGETAEGITEADVRAALALDPRT
jgi:selenocysteine lyase/cysteine desulfurase